VPLLVGQTVITWLLVELAIRKDWRWLLYFAIVANLAVLGLFKYIDFGATILEQVTGREFAKASLILPIGISFYTFELMSWLGIAGLQVLASLRASAPVVCRLGDHDRFRGTAVRTVPLPRPPHRVQYVCRAGRTNRARAAVAGEHSGADRDRRRLSLVQSPHLRACHAAPAELARRNRRRAVGGDLRAPSGRRRPVELSISNSSDAPPVRGGRRSGSGGDGLPRRARPAPS
jgi:hypothetical protein